MASYWPDNLLLYSVYKGHFDWVVRSLVKRRELSCHTEFLRVDWQEESPIWHSIFGSLSLGDYYDREKKGLTSRGTLWIFCIFSHCHTERPFRTLFHGCHSFVTLNDHFWHHPIHQWLPNRRFRHINRYPTLNRKNKCVYFLHLFVCICVPIYYTNLMFIGPCIIVITEEWKSN